MSTENMEKTEYGADQIQILEGLEAVRKRPGMYIGSTSARGLHHLVYEIVDNSVDEALAGYCKNIDVTINPDNSITVIDDGRGIPVGINHKSGLPAVEVVFTVLHAGGKFGGGGYKVSGGLHGVGASVVNALSNWLEVRVYHDGKVYFQRYERGKTMNKLEVIDTCPIEKTGTEVRFLPDDTMFEETVYDYDVLKTRLRETAFLTKGLRIVLRDLRTDPVVEKAFHYEGGIKEFVSYLNKSKTALYPDIIYCEGERDGVLVEVAMQHNDSYQENTYGFVNNITTPEGGTHIVGFRNALTKTFNEYARANKLLKDSEPNLTGEDIREVLSRGLVEREGFRRESSEPAHYGIKPGEVLSRQIENVLTDVSLRLRIVLFVTPESGYVETAGKGFRDNFAGSFAVRGDNCDFCHFEFCLIDVISVVLSVKKKYSEEKFRCQYFYYIKRNPEKISCLTLRPAALNAGVSS